MPMYSLYICIESDSGILSCPRTVTLILFCIWFLLFIGVILQNYILKFLGHIMNIDIITLF